MYNSCNVIIRSGSYESGSCERREKFGRDVKGAARRKKKKNGERNVRTGVQEFKERECYSVYIY